MLGCGFSSLDIIILDRKRPNLIIERVYLWILTRFPRSIDCFLVLIGFTYVVIPWRNTWPTTLYARTSIDLSFYSAGGSGGEGGGWVVGNWKMNCLRVSVLKASEFCIKGGSHTAGSREYWQIEQVEKKHKPIGFCPNEYLDHLNVSVEYQLWGLRAEGPKGLD